MGSVAAPERKIMSAGKFRGPWDPDAICGGCKQSFSDHQKVVCGQEVCGLDVHEYYCREIVVVTRHPALVEYLREIGLVTEATRVVSHASFEDVYGRRVIGVLPLHLASHAHSVTEIPLDLRPEHRGRELSLGEVRELAGDPITYTVRST